MILVGQYDSPYVRRVAISLHLLGMPFERNTISGFADAEEMRRINPLGRIPSLILDDGEVLIDSAAILDHVDEVAGERRLLPASGRARRQALRIIALATGCIDKAGATVYERTLRPAEKVHLPWVERCRVQVVSGLTALEAATGPSWYLGDGPRQPDITVACMFGYMRRTCPEILDAVDHQRLDQLTDSCAKIDAFARTEPSPDETMPSRAL